LEISGNKANDKCCKYGSRQHRDGFRGIDWNMSLSRRWNLIGSLVFSFVFGGLAAYKTEKDL
jgi:hypothetical protein